MRSERTTYTRKFVSRYLVRETLGGYELTVRTDKRGVTSSIRTKTIKRRFVVVVVTDLLIITNDSVFHAENFSQFQIFDALLPQEKLLSAGMKESPQFTRLRI